MPWTREDTRYLIALLAALGLVAYLLAGNFGLVPSPLAGERGPNGQPQVQVPVVTDPTPPPATPAPTVLRTPRPTPIPRPTPPSSGAPTAPPTPSPSRSPSPTPCMLGLICL